MGASASSPAAAVQQPAMSSSQAGGGCPVVAVNQQPTASTSAPATHSAEACPAKYKNPNVYNVYGQRINGVINSMPPNPLSSIRGAEVLDPKNNMPLEPNQLPNPGQRKPLPTERVASTIPKGGTDSTWVYPSPQMVFNGAWLFPSSPGAAAGSWRQKHAALRRRRPH